MSSRSWIRNRVKLVADKVYARLHKSVPDEMIAIREHFENQVAETAFRCDLNEARGDNDFAETHLRWIKQLKDIKS